MVALRISQVPAGESISRGDIADGRMQSHGVVMGNKALDNGSFSEGTMVAGASTRPCCEP